MFERSSAGVKEADFPDWFGKEDDDMIPMMDQHYSIYGVYIMVARAMAFK